MVSTRSRVSVPNWWPTPSTEESATNSRSVVLLSPSAIALTAALAVRSAEVDAAGELRAASASRLSILPLPTG